MAGTKKAPATKAIRLSAGLEVAHAYSVMLDLAQQAPAGTLDPHFQASPQAE